MESPFPKSASCPGKGQVSVKLLPTGASGLETVTYQYPLKLISPKVAPHHRSAILWLLSYGGGLVSGDQVDLCDDAKP